MLVEYIVELIKQIKSKKPIIVSFDGLDTSGKTTLADAVHLEMQKQNLFESQRIQIDRFHNPSEIRTQKGNLSPEGFFYDSFDLEAIFKNIIHPISSGADFIVNGIYDYRTESKILNSKIAINSDSVFLIDGIFMNRDELFEFWDLSIFLDVSFETVLSRAIKRDLELFGSVENIKKRYLNKYIPGQKLYLKSCNPKERSHVVVDNNNYEEPVLLKKWSNRV